MPKATDTKILPAQPRAGEGAAAVQQQQQCTKDPQQGEDAYGVAVKQRRRKQLIGRLLIPCYLVLPSLVFAECPRFQRTPGLAWLHEFPNNLATPISDALAPIGLADFGVVSLIVLVGIVVNWGAARESTGAVRNQPQKRQFHRP